MPRNPPPQEFGPLLRDLFREHKREPALTLNQIREHWEAIAGTEIGSRSRPAKLRRGTLWLDTPDACWAYELQFFKQDLLNSIQVFIKSSTVTDLRFTVARETPASEKGEQDIPPQPPAKSTGVVSPIVENTVVENTAVDYGGVVSTVVDHTAVDHTEPESAAAPPSSRGDADAGDREGGNPLGGAGRTAGIRGDGGDGGKGMFGGKNRSETSVREAFQRMRARRERA